MEINDYNKYFFYYFEYILYKILGGNLFLIYMFYFRRYLFVFDLVLKLVIIDVVGKSFFFDFTLYNY